jgi:hypothetical protein
MLAAAFCLVSDWTAAAQGAVSPQRLEIVTPRGTQAATVLMPTGAGRVPVVVLVSSGNPGIRGELVDALGARGVACLRLDLDQSSVSPSGTISDGARDLAAWITRLRNDSRFERVMVAGAGYASLTASHAARAARADGLILLGPGSGPARSAVTESVGPTIPVTTELEQDPVRSIVQFVRTTSIPRHPEGERRSPRDTVMAEVDGSRMSIEYGRPSKRGRVIWGTLVPWGRWWMPGADEATTFTTSKPIAFGTLNVPAGDYTIYTQPADATFQLILNKETGVFHTVYRAEQDLGRVEMQRTAPASPVEQLTFAIDARDGGGALRLVWDDREYVAPFVVAR